MKKNRLQSHHRDWRRFFLVEMGVAAGVQGPPATAVVGGVFTSTLLTLFLLPILYLLFHRRGKT
jgi:Cu/Ag efflux pump CusA